ncbi:MAG: hypothetical protein H8E31_00610 [Planctomycetes bacterium]|nr:hypothetical protein [Planctomycetota bacterium]
MFEPLSRQFLDQPYAFEREVLAGWGCHGLPHAITKGGPGGARVVV